MYFVPTADFPAFQPTVQTELYNTLECLRVATYQLQAAFDEHLEDADEAEDPKMLPRGRKKEPDSGDYKIDLVHQSLCVCRHFSHLLEEVLTGMPTVSTRVLNALRHFADPEEDEDTHHTRGAFLALKLAARYVAAAYNLSMDLGDELSADHELIVTLKCVIDDCQSSVEGVPGYDDQLLDRILEGRPHGTRDERWREYFLANKDSIMAELARFDAKKAKTAVGDAKA